MEEKITGDEIMERELDKAMEFLLKCLIDTTTDKEILNYKRAIDFYSDKLDEIWE